MQTRVIPVKTPHPAGLVWELMPLVVVVVAVAAVEAQAFRRNAPLPGGGGARSPHTPMGVRGLHSLQAQHHQHERVWGLEESPVRKGEGPLCPILRQAPVSAQQLWSRKGGGACQKGRGVLRGRATSLRSPGLLGRCCLCSKLGQWGPGVRVCMKGGLAEGWG